MMADYDRFVAERKFINEGFNSIIYFWEGYCYKCFRDNFTQERIKAEMEISLEICKTDLPVPKYFESEFPHSLKMEMLNGERLLDCLSLNNYKKLLGRFISILDEIHTIEGLKLPDLTESVIYKIKKNRCLSNEEKRMLLKYLNEIELEASGNICLCHMDYHSKNLIWNGNDLYIIDWEQAGNGNPILDYAQSYTEWISRKTEYCNFYLNNVLESRHYSKELFMKALDVVILHRITPEDEAYRRKLLHELHDGLL